MKTAVVAFSVFLSLTGCGDTGSDPYDPGCALHQLARERSELEYLIVPMSPDGTRICDAEVRIKGEEILADGNCWYSTTTGYGAKDVPVTISAPGYQDLVTQITPPASSAGCAGPGMVKLELQPL